MNAWRKAGKKQRHLLPGNNYFSQLDNLRSTHLEVGELYMEFKKCGDTKCVACCEIPGPVPESIPRPEPNVATQHYKPYSETSTTRRTIDDYQPRKQCKKLFDTGDMSLESAQQIQNFSKKYLVSESIVKQYLSHLTDLDIKKKLRKRQRQDNKSKSKSKSSSQSKKRRTDNESESNTDDETEDDLYEDNEDSEDNSEDDLVLNEVVGSDLEQSDEENVTYVPSLRIATKNGQLSGLWENQFPLETGDYHSSDDEQSSDDEIESENFEMPKTTGVTTRSGRNATAFRL